MILRGLTSILVVLPPEFTAKNVGGGLLRDPKRINQILHALQQSCECPITVKTRIGFEDGKNFSQLLDIFAANEIELLSLHDELLGRIQVDPTI